MGPTQNNNNNNDNNNNNNNNNNKNNNINTDFTYKHFSWCHYYFLGYNKLYKNQKFSALDIFQSQSKEIRLLS